MFISTCSETSTNLTLLPQPQSNREKEQGIGLESTHEGMAANALQSLREQQRLPQAYYKTRILQEPIHARMTGLGDVLSKRMLDPPLVLQVDIDTTSEVDREGETGKNVIQNMNSYLSRALICTVALFHHSDDTVNLSLLRIPEKTIQSSTMAKDNSHKYLVPNLLGTCTKSCDLIPMQRPDGTATTPLFVFHDLAIRIQGEFRLKITVVNTSNLHTESFFSSVISIYSPQYYPGILEPTAVSKWLHGHGIPIKSGFHSNKLKKTGAKGILINELDSKKIARTSKKRRTHLSNTNLLHVAQKSRDSAVSCSASVVTDNAPVNQQTPLGSTNNSSPSMSVNSHVSDIGAGASASGGGFFTAVVTHAYDSTDMDDHEHDVDD